jgi:NADH dehydrogenase
VFAIGDMVRVRDANREPIVLPRVAPVAMQQGRHAAKSLVHGCEGANTPAFRYRDKGNLATIGRAAAVADIKGIWLRGFLAWVTWLVVHLWYLIGFQNRLLVLIRWLFSFSTHGRGPDSSPGLRRTASSTTAEKSLAHHGSGTTGVVV